MKLSVGIKIFGAVVAVLVLMALAGWISVRLMTDVEESVGAVVDRELPALDAVDGLASQILEQDVILQRLAALAVSPDAGEGTVAVERRRFDSLDEEIEDGFGEAIKEATGDAPIADGLKGIQLRYGLYRDKARPLADALAARDRSTFDAQAGDLEAARDAVTGEIAAFRRLAHDAAGRAADRAADNRGAVFSTFIAMTVFAALLGLGAAIVIVRGIRANVRRLTEGAAAIGEGRLDTELAAGSGDELGGLTAAFNDMAAKLRLKVRIRDTFGKYVDPGVVAELLDRPEIANPIGDKRRMTAMFVDLAGFNELAESLSPEAMITLTNAFFDHVSEAVAGNDGVIDKFMGDQVMAYWGPPFNGADAHAGLACRAALQTVDRLDRLRAKVAEALGDEAEGVELDLRIGVSTGEMLVGAVGSAVSKSFTVMGEPVAFGARLEQANKAYGTHILVSEPTRAAARMTGIRFREIDLMRVDDGEPVRVYQLMGPYNGESGLPDRAVSSFETGLERYRSANWDAAANAFRAVLDMAPGDSPAETYLDRIQQFRMAPPPEDWDGVWERRIG